MQKVLEVNWAYPIGSVVIVSLISFVGLFTISLRETALKRWLLLLVSFAAGALLGDAFLHLLPELVEERQGFPVSASITVLAGLILFFVLEKILHWHHAHLPTEEVLHPVAFTNLIGDGLHNLIDGAIIAGAFLSSTKLGIATTIAVALHEIPQEIGDFGILLHAGLKPRRALALNFVTALAAVVGAAITLVASSAIEGLEMLLIPFTIGGFLYIAATDLIPELHKEPEAGKSALQTVALLVGVGVMALLLVFE
ncbi:MAG: ZIP family metal transporter [Acidimicrobiia bacterium]